MIAALVRLLEVADRLVRFTVNQRLLTTLDVGLGHEILGQARP
jgi:hypothetical protein